ncbi:MAG: hypothetical protein AAF721_14815 [Myxococcota bacterium]
MIRTRPKHHASIDRGGGGVSRRLAVLGAATGVLACTPDPQQVPGVDSEDTTASETSSTSASTGDHPGADSGSSNETTAGDGDVDGDTGEQGTGSEDDTGEPPTGGACRRAPFDNTLDLPPNTWVEVTPSAMLPPEGAFAERGYTSMIYSACLGTTVSWEGYLDDVDWFPTIYSNALYTFDPLANGVALLKRNNWSRQGETIPLPANASDPTPPDRHPYGAFADAPERGGFFVWGGANQSLAGGHPTDTWRFDADNTHWAEVDAGNPAPPVMLEAAMAYHAAADRLVLQGNPMGGEGRTFVNDFDGVGWTEVQGAGPGTRSGTRLLYDRERERVVLFGGGAFAAGGNAVWFYDAEGGWTDHTPAVSPPNRKRHGFVHDTDHDVYIAFGGNNAGAGQLLADTWVFDPDAEVWLDMDPDVAPPATGHVDMAYDESTQLAVARLNASWWLYRCGDR